jgi:hypothetical protein
MSRLPHSCRSGTGNYRERGRRAEPAEVDDPALPNVNAPQFNANTSPLSEAGCDSSGQAAAVFQIGQSVAVDRVLDDFADRRPGT